MNEAMQKLIDAVQKASPVVWQAAYRQVWIDGIENILLAVTCALFAKLLWQWRKRMLAEDDDVTEPGSVSWTWFSSEHNPHRSFCRIGNRLFL